MVEPAYQRLERTAKATAQPQQHYTHFARWWNLAPLGAKACSLGREPQEREVKIESQSPGGATAGHRSEENCRRPSGALGWLGAQFPGADAPGYMPLPLAGQIQEGRRVF